MKSYTVALFGEAEKGEYKTPYLFNRLDQLIYLGNPPNNSKGLYYAIQALMYDYTILFFRVVEEGFSIEDYEYGIQLLKTQQEIKEISALCIPGVGNKKIIDAAIPLCAFYHSILITTESDLYDYLTTGTN